MKLRLVREQYRPDSTIGRMFVDDVFECFTLEDGVSAIDRGEPVSIAVVQESAPAELMQRAIRPTARKSASARPKARKPAAKKSAKRVGKSKATTPRKTAAKRKLSGKRAAKKKR